VPPGPPTPPPGNDPTTPLTPPGPPLNPAGGGSVYGRGDAKANLLGYLAVLFGVIGTGCCCCPWLNGAPLVGGIPAIVLGVLHLQKVKRGQSSMDWLAWVGIALGVLALIGAVCGLTTDFDNQIRDQYDRQFDNM